MATLATAGGSGGGRGGGSTVARGGRSRWQAVILLWLFFFPWCRDTTIVLEEQTMASLMKMVVSLPLRFVSSLFLLSLVLSPSLFCFGFSSVAAGGSADGGGMEVLDGGGRRPRWRERSSCWEPEKDDFVF